jgi:hypothetical protein
VKTDFFNRADLLLAAGFSTLTCAFLLLAAPRVGIVLLEILAGLCLLVRAYVVRARLRKANLGGVTAAGERNGGAGRRFLGRYELVLIILVIAIHSSISGSLHSRGLAEGFVRILPLVLFALGLLAKPRVLRWIEARGVRNRLGGVES